MADDPITADYVANNGFRARLEPDEESNVHPLKRVALELRPAEDIDPKMIPPRRWLYGRALVRSFVSVLVAPGGTGKSLWAMAVGVSLAIGRSLLGEHVFCRTNVWLINLDDPMDELNRRFAALRIHFHLEASEWYGRFFMNSGEERSLVMAKMELTKEGFAIVHPDEAALETHIRDNNIGLLIVDPFAESHTLEENSNPQMVAATAAWRRVARSTGCSTLLVHHVRKGGAGGDIESARGAKALTDSARVGLVMSTMSEEEALALGIEAEARLSYVRMDDAKANLAPRAGSAKWFRLDRLELGNCTLDYPDGDQVAVITRWTAPTTWEGIDSVVIGKIFDRLEEGPEPNEHYSLMRQAKDRWAGHAVMEVTGGPATQAAAMLAAWKKDDVLSEGTYLSPKRRSKETGRIVINEARAAMIRQGSTGDGI